MLHSVCGHFPASWPFFLLAVPTNLQHKKLYEFKTGSAGIAIDGDKLRKACALSARALFAYIRVLSNSNRISEESQHFTRIFNVEFHSLKVLDLVRRVKCTFCTAEPSLNASPGTTINKSMGLQNALLHIYG
jgi:hypothetical protein